MQGKRPLLPLTFDAVIASDGPGHVRPGHVRPGHVRPGRVRPGRASPHHEPPLHADPDHKPPRRYILAAAFGTRKPRKRPCMI